VKGKHTHVIVERIVADIDAIVKQVRFDGWQATAQGEREVKQALRRSLARQVQAAHRGAFLPGAVCGQGVRVSAKEPTPDPLHQVA
jgi:hypothetical protein